MEHDDILIRQWSETIRRAAAESSPLRLRGGGTKDFYGRESEGAYLEVGAYAGIRDYEPSELVVTVKGGTSLAHLEAVLAEQNQFLAFEPPHFGSTATAAGCFAAGLSGPRRAYAGAVRDYVLGVKVLDGRGQVQTFGGQVMKNVAGYDVSRLLAGSLGTLGVVLEISFKVVPRPPGETTLRLEMDESQAMARLNAWAGRPLPISASAWEGGVLMLRLSGADPATRLARQDLGGEVISPPQAQRYWQALREHALPWFAGRMDRPLWRLSLPSTAPPLGLEGDQLVEWGGALRWYSGPAQADEIRRRAQALGGHATWFRGHDGATDVFQPMNSYLLGLHRCLKQAFDPAGIFNPGRIYQGL